MAHDRDVLAALDAQADALQRVDGDVAELVGLVDVADVDHRHVGAHAAGAWLGRACHRLPRHREPAAAGATAEPAAATEPAAAATETAGSDGVPPSVPLPVLEVVAVPEVSGGKDGRDRELIACAQAADDLRPSVAPKADGDLLLGLLAVLSSVTVAIEPVPVTALLGTLTPCACATMIDADALIPGFTCESLWSSVNVAL